MSETAMSNTTHTASTAKRVLVTGASGCIGQVTARHLVEAGYEVHGTSRSAHPRPIDGVTWHQIDLVAPKEATRIIHDLKPDHLIHLAWYMSAGNWQASGGDEHLDFMRATTHLVQAFRHMGGQRAVLAGSGTEYDWNLDTYPETASRQPASFYGQAKSATGDLMMGYAELERLSLVWARIFFMYGGAEAQNRLVPSVILNLLRGKEAETSDGTQIRDFLYVEDIARAFVNLLNSEATGAVNIGSGEGVTLRSIIEKIGELTGRPELLRIGAIPQAPGDTPKVVADNTLLRNTGWIQKYDLEAGLRETIDYWQHRLDQGDL